MSQHTIYLDKALPKCIAASFPCALKGVCAKHLVSADGRRLSDYSTPDGTCGQYQAASQHRAPPSETRPVHEAPEGLR